VPGKEEYLDSEKYQFKGRDWNAPGNIKDYITRLNHIRRDNRALREYDNLRVQTSESDSILAFSKATAALDNMIYVAVSVDPWNPQSGFVHVPIEALGIGHDEDYRMEDLLTGEKFTWRGPRNYVALDPHNRPAHVFRIRRQVGRRAGEVQFA
jgi:starch synthase (maltosyl-transferring)